MVRFKLDDFHSKELPQLKIRAGSIIPIQAVIYNTSEVPEYIGLVIALDDNHTARGELYEDSGDGFEFEKGNYLISKYTARKEGENIIIDISEEGHFPRSQLTLKIWVILSNEKTITYTTQNTGTSISFPLSF